MAWRTNNLASDTNSQLTRALQQDIWSRINPNTPSLQNVRDSGKTNERNVEEKVEA